MRKLVIRVVDIKGKCGAYKLGDKIVLDEGYRVNLKESTAICMHSLGSIFPYYNMLYAGGDPKRLGLLEKGNPNSLPRVRCLDPNDYTGGGSTTFEIECVEE
jgi:uncharacterized repeat protein (TIGR04076 family)